MSTWPVAQAVSLAVDQLRLCAVGRGTSVMVYADADSRPELVGATVAAADVLGANAFTATVASVGSMRADPPAAVRVAAGAVDLVVDVSSRGMLHSTMQVEVLAAGARILRAREPVEVLARLHGDPSIRGRVERAASRIDAASTMRVTSAVGTDIIYSLEGRTTTTQYGYTDEPGRWDHWGTALVAAAPRETVGTGTIVLAPGDRYFLGATVGLAVPEDLRIEMVDGAIVDLVGGQAAAHVASILDSDRFGPDARRASHVGWGLDDRAQWDALDRYGRAGGGGADLRSVAGGVVLAFGANADMGGDNETLAHMDLALRGCTVEVDGAVVVDAGVRTPDDSDQEELR